MATTPGGSMRFAHTRSPSLPRVPSSPGGMPNRHGSMERESGDLLDVFGRPRDWSSNTPPAGAASPRSPGTPRSGEEDDSRRPERAERRERQQEHREGRRANPTEPVGLNFRLQACETTLRDHTNELAAQKIMMQQLVEAVKSDGINKTKLEERLNVSFTQSNTLSMRNTVT